MRALTVRQPWAWAIVHGGKDVENRTQAWAYRGPLAIHAGARLSERGLESPLIREAVLNDEHAPAIVDGNSVRGAWAAGAVIGVVDLVGVHTADSCRNPWGQCSPWAESSYDEHGGRTRRDVVHLVLADPRPLQVPIPAKGRLGLWTPDDGLLERIREQVTS